MKVDYCSPKWLLWYYCFCQKHYCNTITVAGSYCNTYAITIIDIICLKKTKDFHEALVLMTSRVEILFESQTIAVIFDELSTYWHQKCLCLFRFVGFLFLLGSGKGCGLWLWHSLDFSLTFFVYFRVLLAHSNTFLLMIITCEYILFIDRWLLFIHLIFYL